MKTNSLTSMLQLLVEISERRGSAIPTSKRKPQHAVNRIAEALLQLDRQR